MFPKTILIIVLSINCVHKNCVTDAIVISNLNLLFEIFNPMSMVRFYEFNDKGWNITNGCIQDMFLYLDGLHKDIFWAVKLYDASGYYSGGIYDGNEIRTGNAHLCTQLNNEFNQHYLTNGPQYQPSNVSLPFGVRTVNAQYNFQLDNGPLPMYKILQTVCMPASCSFEDLQQVMTFSTLPNIRTKEFMTNVDLISIRILTQTNRWTNELAVYFFICITSLTLILMFMAIIYEKCTQFEANVDLKQTEPPNRSPNEGPRPALSHVTKLNNSERDSLTKFHMHPLTNTLTVNNFNTNKHVNLVQVKKIKYDNTNTIGLDIVSGKCENAKTVKYKDKRNSNKHLSKRLLLAFSWRQNYRMFLSRKQNKMCNEIPAICGIKVFCIIWINLIHICTIIQYVCASKLNTSLITGYFLHTIQSNGVYAIDTYFFLSGATISHLFYCTANSTKLEDVTSFLQHIFHFLILILCKLLRIFLPYLIILILLQLSMKYFHEHNVLEIPSQDHLTCSDHMWKNLLYIDTFYPIKQRCMIWSWFLSLETHFFIVACIVLLLARNHHRYAVVICTAFFISSFITTTILRYNKRSKSSLSYDENLEKLNGMYDQPSARIAPYLLGMCLGYILFKSKEKIHIHWLVIICGWIASILILFGITFEPYFFKDTNLWIKAAASSITHTFWSMILFWIILVSISQQKGFIGEFISKSAFIPLSKLSNCFLLVHPLITRFIILNSDTTFHLTIGLIIILYVGFTIAAFVVSFFLYMIYEAPVVSLLNILYHKHFK